ncbi:hypothetical protein NPIL_256141 [Nephila pilipes]|uniref:Uncharacterized protein n=1 Tax=Nephila pilipes TaxID=299642 RepID=A0A8X6QID3_NEPPI|nr:hypothetical protein NPIL_256141 [Nephila pilipes]
MLWRNRECLECTRSYNTSAGPELSEHEIIKRSFLDPELGPLEEINLSSRNYTAVHIRVDCILMDTTLLDRVQSAI